MKLSLGKRLKDMQGAERTALIESSKLLRASDSSGGSSNPAKEGAVAVALNQI